MALIIDENAAIFGLKAQGFFTLPRPEPFAAFRAPTGVLAVKVLLAKLVKVFWYLSDLEAFHDIS